MSELSYCLHNGAKSVDASASERFCTLLWYKFYEIYPMNREQRRQQADRQRQHAEQGRLSSEQQRHTNEEVRQTGEDT